MSLYKQTVRYALAPLVLLAGLGACGFEPIYAPGGSAAMLQDRVVVQAPETVVGYRMVAELERQIGRGATPDYYLSYDLDWDEEAQAVTAENETLRYTLVGTVDYTLKDQASGVTLVSGEVEDFVGYSASGTSLETESALRDAEQRLGVALANRLISKLYGTVDAE